LDRSWTKLSEEFRPVHGLNPDLVWEQSVTQSIRSIARWRGRDSRDMRHRAAVFRELLTRIYESRICP
jgi:hypothetical protein